MTVSTQKGPEFSPSSPSSPETAEDSFYLAPPTEQDVRPEDEDGTVGIEWDNLKIRVPGTNRVHGGYRLDMDSLVRDDDRVLQGSVLGSMYESSPHKWPIAGLVYEQIVAATRQYEAPLPEVYTQAGSHFIPGWRIKDIEQQNDGGLVAVMTNRSDDHVEPWRISVDDLVKTQRRVFTAQLKGRVAAAATR